MERWSAARTPADTEPDPDSLLASEKELALIAAMRRRLASLLAEDGISQTDDVVGNWGMLRFIRAHHGAGGMDLVCDQVWARGR